MLRPEVALPEMTELNNVTDTSKVDTRTEHADTISDIEATNDLLFLKQHNLSRGSTTSVDDAGDPPESSRAQNAGKRGRLGHHLLLASLK